MTTAEISDLIKIEVNYRSDTKHALWDSLIWGVSIAGILFLFRPFGLSDDNLLHLLFTSLGYGITTFITLVVNLVFIKKFLYRSFHEIWTIKHELFLLLLICIQAGFLNFLFGTLLLRQFSFSLTGASEVFTYSSSLLVLVFLVKNTFAITMKYSAEKIRLQTRADYYNELNDYLHAKKNDDKVHRLSFESEELDLQLNRVVLISAWGNYLKILVESDAKNIELVKRGSVKNIETQLMQFAEFYRCHRSYIINMNYVLRVKGNTKTASAILKTDNLEVPISREKIKRLKNIFP